MLHEAQVLLQHYVYWVRPQRTAGGLGVGQGDQGSPAAQRWSWVHTSTRLQGGQAQRHSSRPGTRRP